MGTTRICHRNDNSIRRSNDLSQLPFYFRYLHPNRTAGVVHYFTFVNFEWKTMATFRTIKNQKNGEIAIYEGFEYQKDKVTNEKKIWRCVK